MQVLHQLTLETFPDCNLWFLDSKNSENKVVANPNIGYGTQMMEYAEGTSKEFYKIGWSANKTGISIYIIGIKDKTYISQTYGKDIGKASITGYCIKFKSLKDINISVLKKAIRFGFENE